MHWVKKGLIFTPAGEGGWMRSHAQVPTVLVRPDAIRIYFAARPSQEMSHTTYLDVDPENPGRILEVHDEPILDWGPPGSFDEHGIMPQCVFERHGVVYLYYAGWSRRVSIPYSNWTGLALSHDGGRTFAKHADVPVLDRAPGETLSATGLFCLPEANGFRGWYATGLDWIEVNGQLESRYQIRYAKSEDGIHWLRDNKPVLPPVYADEANTRPMVIQLGDRWHMWYCYRNCRDYRDGPGSYRIGHAWSTDGSTWVRDDAHAGIEPSASGWDSLMQAYPYVVRVGEKVYMFYNGNGFGRTGIGYAMLEM